MNVIALLIQVLFCFYLRIVFLLVLHIEYLHVPSINPLQEVNGSFPPAHKETINYEFDDEATKDPYWNKFAQSSTWNTVDDRNNASEELTYAHHIKICKRFREGIFLNRPREEGFTRNHPQIESTTAGKEPGGLLPSPFISPNRSRFACSLPCCSNLSIIMPLRETDRANRDIDHVSTT